MDINGLKSSLEEWKVKAESAQKEADDKLSKMKFDYLINGALSSAKAKNITAAKALLDMESLKLEGDEVYGLIEQISRLKKESAFLFEGEQDKAPYVVKGAGGYSLNNALAGDPNTMDYNTYKRWRSQQE
jgi:hypothetical protein